MRMRPVVIAVAVAALLGAACSSSSSNSSDTTTDAKNPSGMDLAQQVSLRQADVGTGDIVTPIPQGDQVAGQVTLDLCGGVFASEQQRQVRYRVQTVTPNGRSAGVGTEAVLYASPEAAQEALEEVRAAQANCPPGFVTSTVPDVPPVKTVFGPAPDAAWPQQAGVDRLAQDVTISTEDGRSLHKLLAFQVRGAMLVGIYVTPETASKHLDGSIGGVKELVRAVAKRLAALPDDALANAPAV